VVAGEVHHRVLRDATLWKTSDEDFDTVIDVHLRGTFTCVRAAPIRLRAQGDGGRIIRVGSPTETLAVLAPPVEALRGGEPPPPFARRELGFGSPADAAGLVAFLASDAAAVITGQADGIGGDQLPAAPTDGAVAR
jgi:NAD(P)-dependent dehydrogenase (short-subunit alcohol dehydrogenase family)